MPEPTSTAAGVATIAMGAASTSAITAFGAWHYFHELYMSPPPDNPLQTGIQKSIARFYERYIKGAKGREEARLAVKKFLYSSGIWLAILTPRANNDIKYDYVNRFSNSFEVEVEVEG